MEKKYIIDKGDCPKYKLTIEHAEFNQLRDDFKVILSWGCLCGEQVFTKDDIFIDEDGDSYLVFSTADMIGPVLATCKYYVPDEDFESGVREEVDLQYLCIVVDTPTPRFCGELHFGGDGHVTYERVYRSDVKTLYLNLRTNDGEYIKDVDGKQLRVHKEQKDIY